MIKNRWLDYRMRALTAVLAGWALCLATASSAGEFPPDDAVVVEFSVDAEAVGAARNSVDLIDAIHRSLGVKAGSPLDMEIIIHVIARTSQGAGHEAVETGSGIMLNLEKGVLLDGLISDLKFFSSLGMSEAETWDYFHDQVLSFIVHGMNASQTFEEDNGQTWLQVTDVLGGDENIEADGNRMVLEIGAELLYRDGSKFGSKTPPDGYREIQQTVKIVLEPMSPQADNEVAASATGSGAKAAATDRNDAIAGTYGEGRGGLRIERQDDVYVLSNPAAPSPEYYPLTALEDGRYSVDFNGTPVTLKFPMNDKGQSISVVVQQGDFERIMPRN